MDNRENMTCNKHAFEPIVITLKEFTRLYHIHKHNRSSWRDRSIDYTPKPKFSVEKNKVVTPRQVETRVTPEGVPYEFVTAKAVTNVVPDTNGITNLILAWFDYHFENQSLRRISSEGKYRKGVGFIPSSNKGMSDIEGLVNGKFWSIELKVGRDKQRDSQIKRQQEIEKSGGLYWLLKWTDFETFQVDFQNICRENNVFLSLI